jgi:hypothetical protein
LALLPGSDDPIRWQLTVLSVVAGLVAPLLPDRGGPMCWLSSARRAPYRTLGVPSEMRVVR